jgi:hypothetical protein
MIEQLEWTTLEERRKHSRLLMMYKLKNNIVPFKKTDGVVGFRADGAYMFTQFEV